MEIETFQLDYPEVYYRVYSTGKDDYYNRHGVFDTLDEALRKAYQEEDTYMDRETGYYEVRYNPRWHVYIEEIVIAHEDAAPICNDRTVEEWEAIVG